jgi:hypothetical protein
VANTKSITDNTERKSKKRAQRKALKATHAGLSTKAKKAYRKSETSGLRTWIAEQAKGD